MGTYCCKSEYPITEQNKKVHQIIVSEFRTIPCTQEDYDDIYQTRPPCWFGHDCPCPCHRGGQCSFK